MVIPERDGGASRILVADDESLNRILLFTSLQEAGYAVETAEDGQQALEILRARRFDAVLLDLIMPRMDGYQVLAVMKQDAALRRVPVIVVSSSDEVDSIVRCIEMGATDYLTKPFNPVLLHARIRASLASLHEERMALLRDRLAQVTAAQEEERQRMARELHDGLGPALASLNIRLLTVQRQLLRDGHPAASELGELAAQAQASVRDIRRLIYDLRPVALDELGLVAAVREHLARCEQEHDLVIRFSAGDPAEGAGLRGERLPAPVETALFRIVQEAVNNVIRHAQAQHLSVSLTRNAERVQVRITDDGQGFDAQLPRSGPHIGLWSMCQRVEQLGGQFELRSAPGQGATVTATLPL
jgi:two-component system, NarL family, sensor histidine kinase DegS